MADSSVRAVVQDRVDHRRGGPDPLSDLPVAAADHMAVHRDVPGRRAVDARERAEPLHEARVRDRPGLPGAVRCGRAAGRAARPADRERGERPRRQRAQLRAGRARYVEKNERLREINNDYQITDKLEEEAAKLPEKLGGAAGRAARHRLRDRERHLRVRDDPGADRVHAERRPPVAPPGDDAATAGSRGAHRPRPGPHGARRQRVCRGSSDHRADRGHRDVHRADDPRGGVRRAARVWSPASSHSCRSWAPRSPRC